MRRAKVLREKEAEIVLLLDREFWAESPGGFAEGIADDRLRLMFVCCHPVLPHDDQVALTLKTLCGFSPAEIAKAFLTTEAAIQKRLTRAKLRIRETNTPFAIPEGEELARRLEGVLQSLYLLFNEGYKASSGERLVREDLNPMLSARRRASFGRAPGLILSSGQRAGPVMASVPPIPGPVPSTILLRPRR